MDLSDKGISRKLHGSGGFVFGISSPGRRDAGQASPVQYSKRKLSLKKHFSNG